MASRRRRPPRFPQRDGFDWRAAVTVGAVMLAAVLAALLLLAALARGEAGGDLRSWIATHCCVTNDCCFEIAAHDVTALADDRFRINASGQVLKRSGFSPDGRWYRCACDSIGGQWVVHPAAHTRCLFVPAMGS